VQDVNFVQSRAQKTRSLTRSIKPNNQASLPFFEPSTSSPLKPINPCNCNGLGVQYTRKLEEQNAPSVARTTDEANQPNVIAHAGVDSTSIVQQSLDGIKRRTMEVREHRRLQIAASSTIIQKDGAWNVPSQRSGKTYTVYLNPAPSCTCADYESRRKLCKHIYAVLHLLQHQQLGTPVPAPPKPIKNSVIKREWSAYNQAATKEKNLFQSLLSELCKGIAEPPQVMGRPRVLLSDLVFCAGLKVYSTFSGRRNMSDLCEAQEKSYISKAVHYNTVSKYLERKSLTPVLRELITQSSLPLQSIEPGDFAVDSTGLSTGRFVRWFDVKYGNTEDWRDWIKLHLMTGIKTNIVTSCEVSRRYSHDSLYFKPLVNATVASGFNLHEVSGDKAYSSRASLRLVKSHGGTPYIAFKDNSRGDSKCKVWNQMFHYYSLNQAEYMQHYHKRSNVESTFSMIKARFGGKLMSKTERAQVNEALCKVVCHNICVVIQSMHELGIEVEFIGSL
jgi:transposase